MGEQRYTIQRRDHDRRRVPRHEDLFSVHLMSESGEPGELCDLRDISTHGLGLAGPDDDGLLDGPTVLVEFPLGRSSSRIRTRCRFVERTNKERDTVHLEFLDESEFFRATLRGCIESWEARLLPDRRQQSAKPSE